MRIAENDREEGVEEERLVFGCIACELIRSGIVDEDELEILQLVA